MKSDKGLKEIRFIIYLTTIFYGIVNALQPPPASVGTLVGLAIIIGVTQLIASIIGLISEFFSGGRAHRVRGASLLILTVAFLYEFVFVLLVAGSPFSWAPLFVYGTICAVLYLSE